MNDATADFYMNKYAHTFLKALVHLRNKRKLGNT